MSEPPKALAAQSAVRLDGLDGLRGVASLAIVTPHMFDGCDLPVWRVHQINVLRPLDRFPSGLDLMFAWRAVACSAMSSMVMLLSVPPRANPIRWLCSIKRLRWMGQASYSIYLFHLPFVTLFCIFLRRVTHSDVKSFFPGMMLIPMTTLIARKNYLVFERPFMGTNTPKPAGKPLVVATT